MSFGLSLCVLLLEVFQVKEAKIIRKTLNLLRKMDYWQRMMVFDWLRDWYEYEKEREQE
jgi:hypothetical protein